MNHKKYAGGLFVIIAAGLLAGPNAQAGSERSLQGECQTVFKGEVCTWAKMNGDELVAFGATVPMSTVENAPLEGEMVFPPVALARIPLPAAVTERTGVDHLGVNWEMHGHPPGPFLTPHFDFHFYTASGAEIEAIDCSNTAKPDSIPATYVLPDLEIPDMGTMIGLCVPQMGMHAVVEEEMNATELFGASMILGYYAGKTVFIEPMVARDRLLDRENFTLAVPAMTGIGELGSRGSSFEAEYDEKADAYRFMFSLAAGE